MMAGRVASNIPRDPNHSEELAVDMVYNNALWQTRRRIHVESEPKYLHVEAQRFALRASGPHV
jgi:hypothetical protein